MSEMLKGPLARVAVIRRPRKRQKPMLRWFQWRLPAWHTQVSDAACVLDNFSGNVAAKSGLVLVSTSLTSHSDVAVAAVMAGMDRAHLCVSFQLR